MQRRVRTAILRGRPGLPVTAALVALAVAGCGGSGQSAQGLLGQTFSKGHSIRSGLLTFSLSAVPSGSRTFTIPVSLTISGPFRSRGAGQVPASDFAITLSGLRRSGTLGVVSTGTTGYLTVAGTGYRLPPTEFQRLASSFSSAGGPAAASGGASALGLDPMRWLVRPTIVGSATVAGASTTHIHAGVDLPALLGSLDRLLARAAGTAGSSRIPSSIPPATERSIEASVTNSTVDVWTANSDHTLRRLAVSLDLSVSGRASVLLGGMKSAAIRVTIQYADINQPQTISAPSRIAPYSQFTARLGRILTTGLGVPGTGALGSASGPGGSAGGSRYGLCMQRAAGDVTKMQRCSSLLNAG